MVLRSDTSHKSPNPSHNNPNESVSDSEMEETQATSQEIPEGIPVGLPKEMWIQYLTIQAEVKVKEIELENTKQIKLKELELKEPNQNNCNSNRNQENESVKTLKFRKLHPTEDIDLYLRAFERFALNNNLPKQYWATKLAPELTGSAFEVYATLTFEESNDYDTLKSAILKKCEISAETFRSKFRSRDRNPNETVGEWVHDLTHYLNNWIEFSDVDKTDGLKIIELMAMEQAMNKMPEDLAIYLRDNKPQSINHMTQLADDYIANRGGTKDSGFTYILQDKTLFCAFEANDIGC